MVSSKKNIEISRSLDHVKVRPHTESAGNKDELYI